MDFPTYQIFYVIFLLSVIPSAGDEEYEPYEPQNRNAGFIRDGRKDVRWWHLGADKEKGKDDQDEEIKVAKVTRGGA